MTKPDRPALPPQRPREPPVHPGDVAKTCANCQHFEKDKRTARDGACHNGISGRITTRLIDGCAFGFYPDVVRFPLRAGPGGIR